MQKMKRKDIQVCLFLAFIFMATGSFSATAIRIHNAEAGGFKLKPAHSREGSAAGFMSATWNKSGMQVKENYRKVPSAPNPIGNRHPPAKLD